MYSARNLCLFSILLLLVSPFVVDSNLIESERLEEYERRGHSWPPKEEDFTPNTDGWRAINKRRFSQVEQLEDSGDRYQGYMLAVHSGLIMQNFTEYGWAVTRAPKPIVDKLKKRLHDGLQNIKQKETKENKIACVETDNTPYFLRDSSMNRDILEAMLPLHEAWAGVDLVPNNAYGLR